MVTVKNRKGESFESLFRRFSRRVQQSGNMLETRKNRYHESEPNKTRVHKSALRRIVARTKREYLVRIGQMEDQTRGRSQGGRR